MRTVAIFAAALLYINIGNATATGSTWPTYQANISHTGYVPQSLDTSTFSLRWQRSVTNGTALNPVAAGDGKVFISNYTYFNGASLFVYDAQTGTEQWSLNFGNIFSANPPAYANGNVYIQTGNHASDTYLRAYNATSGQLVFQTAHAAQWERYYAPTIAGDTVYVDGGYYGGMYAFDAHDGSQRWFHPLQQYDQWTPAVDDNYAYAYVGEYSPALYVLDRGTGTEVYNIPDLNFQWDGWSMNLAPVLGGANDVLAIHDGRLIRFDTANRKIAWELRRSFTGQPSVARGVIYAIDAGALSARDQLTGALLWSWGNPTDSLSGAMIVTDSHVLVSGQQATYAVDLQSHQSTWSYPATGYLALGENVLYIASGNGSLTAIDIGPPPDIDGDGISDREDNCPDVPNPGQADTDGDGIGDSCNQNIDSDGDEWADSIDNCPTISNSGQENSDSDSLGDVCDPYPTNPQNLDACLADIGSSNQEIATLKLQIAGLQNKLQDDDKDGVINQYDRCAGSPSGRVDTAGCTKTQFCAGFLHPQSCNAADWRNDEPRGSPDCHWNGRLKACQAAQW